MRKVIAALAVCLLSISSVIADCTYIDRLDQEPLLVCTSLCFDPNLDGVIDSSDVIALINYIYSGGPLPPGPSDFNKDGHVNEADLGYLIDYLFFGTPGPSC